MRSIERPAGYVTTSRRRDTPPDDHELRHCCHCGFIWRYQPGSGARRGVCLKHGGLVCGRAECEAQQARMVAAYMDNTGRVVSCLAFSEWCDSMKETAAKGHGVLGIDFTINQSGILVPV